MTGTEYLKEKRKEKGYTVRGFAAACGVAPRMVSYYESGEKSVSSMPVIKAQKYFGMLGINIETYFKEYYSYLSEVDSKVEEWYINNPRTLEKSSLKRRYCKRLAKIKERKYMDISDFDNIYNVYQDIFNNKVNHEILSENEYNRYILELNYKIRIALNPLNNEISEISKTVLDALYHTEFSITDISSFCGLSKQHVCSCIQGGYDIRLIHVISALKLCYVLDLSFEEVFHEVSF